MTWIIYATTLGGAGLGLCCGLLTKSHMQEPNDLAQVGIYWFYRYCIRPGLYTMVFGAVGFFLGAALETTMYIAGAAAAHK